MLYDAVVVGTGPGGSTAARYLARAGAQVALLDRERLPRYKTCGGGLVERAVHLMPPDIRSVVQRDCHRLTIGLEGACGEVRCERTEPLVFMTMRAELDLRLASAAQLAGAELMAPCAVRGLSLNGDRVVLQTSRGSLEARFVVAADGATGILSRAAGWPPNVYTAPALELEIEVPDDVLHRFTSAARFDFGVAPRGYAWVFPKREHLSVGILSTRRGRPDLHRCLKSYLERIGITSTRRLERHGYVIPLKPVAQTFVRNRTMLVGDAAGLADPVLAEGISAAVLSGALAAEAILEGELDEPRVCQAYERRLRERILPDLHAGRRLARILYGAPRLRRLVYERLGQQIADTVANVMSGRTTYRAAFAGPATYVGWVRQWYLRERGRVTAPQRR